MFFYNVAFRRHLNNKVLFVKLFFLFKFVSSELNSTNDPV